MSHNRHSSSLRRLNKQKQRQVRRKSNRQNIGYETLELRQMLAGDVGLNFDTTPFGAVPGGSPINSSGAVGPAHVVEVTDSGMKIFDKATGAELVSKSLRDFWLDSGGAGAQARVELADSGNHHDSRILYDADERRWFMVSVTGLDISSALGTQNSVLLAISRSSDPTEDWSTPLDFYDEDGDPATPDVPFRGGFRTFAQTPQSLGLSVDDHNLYVTVDEGNPFAPDLTYVFNKFSDLVVPNATALNSSVLVHGRGSLQWGMDTVGDEVGTFGLFVPNSGNSITLYEATNPEVAGGVGLGAQTPIPVPAYNAPPPFVRQLFDADLVNSSAQLSAHTVRNGDSMWAVHAIEGANGTSALQWYEIDVVNKTILQTDTIDHPTDNFIYPSIAVTDAGNIAISYTITGVDRFPSHAVSFGYLNNGITEIEEPLIVGEGESGYFDGRGNLWGAYQTSFVDTDNPEDVWFFGQRTDGAKNGVTRVTQVSVVGSSPSFEADGLDNTIIVRRQTLDGPDIEVEIDGAIVGVHEEQFLHSITIDGMGGDDTFIVDTANGELAFLGGVNFIGDDDDQVELQTDIPTNWDIGVDGTGQARIGDDFHAACSGRQDDEVTINLNFEAGSRWFDATPFGTGTFGDALRDALTTYVDDVIAPIFAGTFELTIDINDDETDAFASSEALGGGFEEIEGREFWVASPWSILTDRGDRNGAASDAVINYNLGLDLYGGDRQALLDNIGGGLTWFEMKKILGMESFIENATPSSNDIGNRHTATLFDWYIRDSSLERVLVNYDPLDKTHEVGNYTTNADWSNDGSGLYFRGEQLNGLGSTLPLNSNLQLINFDVLASALAGTSRDGDWGTPNEQDRQMLRRLGYDLNPVLPATLDSGFQVNFERMDLLFSGDGADYFCITSSNVDLEIHGGGGDDYFNVTELGVGAVDLHGEAGDDTYQVAFSSAGAITITDSVGAENDTLIGVGTDQDDYFIIDALGIDVNGGVFAQSGVENYDFDGRDGDDVFDVRASVTANKYIDGGLGNDRFFFNDQGAGGNQNQLEFMVEDPDLTPEDRLRLNLSTVFTDTYTTDNLETLEVDGLFLANGVNGTPTVAGGLTLLGDGDDRLKVESQLDANWAIDGDGSGTVTMDVEPMTFLGLDEIEGTNGDNVFDISNTNTDMRIQTFTGEDVFNITNVGTGVLNVHGGNSNDLFRIVNSGGGVFLFGENGDDHYDIDFSNPGGLITIRDSINSENDSMSAFGTDGDDHFIFDGSVIGVNGVLVDHLGVENVVYDGMDGDDLFEVRSTSSGGVKVISGGAGNDRFWVNDMGAGANGNQIEVTVANPSTAVNQVRLDVTSVVSDTFLADTIENLDVDGKYLFNGVNGTPTVAGGFNLLGDGNERLEIDSNLTAAWTINGNGSGFVQMDVDPMTFNGLASIISTHADETFDVNMTNTDLEIDTRDGVEIINLTNVGTGIVTVRSGNDDDIFNINNSGGGVFLYGQVGDDTYNVDFSNPGGLITIRDSINAEWDTMTAFGTNGDDHFIFDGSTTGVNGVMVDHQGVENVSYDGMDGDDTFEVKGSSGGDAKVIHGGAGNDIFIVNDMGAGANGNVLEVSVANPSTALNQVQLDITSVITDTFLADSIENLSVDGLYIFDGVNGTPTVAGGFNLLGDGNERLEIDSNIPAVWGITGNGAGTVTMDVEPMTFNGLELIDGSHGVDTVSVTNTGTDLEIRTRESVDVIDINNAGAGVVTVRAGDGDDFLNVLFPGPNGVFLYGELGDDTYSIDMTTPGGGVITIRDSINAENDTLNVLGTPNNDHFIFDGGVVNVNGVQVDVSGIENGGFDGLAGDDIFEVISSGSGTGTGIRGGAGNDTFIVNDGGAGLNGNTLRVSVANPGVFADQVRLDITSVITDTFFADAIENLSVDGTYILDGVNGTPTVAGGFNLLGDGNERLIVESNLAAGWVVNGDGSGTLTMDVDPLTFNGLESIDASHGVDTFSIVATNTDLAIRGRESDDTFDVANTGTGILTVDAGDGVDTFNVTNSGGGVNLAGDAGNDLFNYADVGTGFGNILGGDGDDTFEIMNSGSNVLNVFGGSGVDTININNPTGTAETTVFAGDGDDFLNVIHSGLGDLTLRGEDGDDTYTVQHVDPSIAFMIRDSINAESDTLLATGTDGDDVFDIGPGGTSFNGFPWDVQGIENYGYDGLAGNDTFNVNTGDAWTGDLTLRGGSGDDIFNIINSGSGTMWLYGDSGNDTYNVWFLPATDVRIEDSIGSENDRFFGYGTDGVDVFNVDIGAANVNGGTVVMTGIESVDYDARGADDIFNISDTQVTSTFRGGDGSDDFNITESNGNADFIGGTGDDTFVIGNAAGNNRLFGNDGVDQFTVTNHVPRGTAGSMLIDGGADRNQLIVNGYATTNVATVTSSRITGLSGVPIDYVSSGSFTVADDFGGITLHGSNENDAFDVNSFLAKNSLHMNGFDGNDRFTVQATALGGISADGGEGADLYQYAVGTDDNRFLFATDTGTTGNDRLVATLTDLDDDVRLSGTAFRVRTDNVKFENLEALVVNARAGDDTIDVDRIPVGFVRVIGGSGNDIVNVNNFNGINSMLVNLDDGDDVLNINAGSVTGTITAFGGDGDDTFVSQRAAYSNAFLDGQEGSDTYDIFILDRSKRTMVARDTGTTGTDTVKIHGTALDDNLVLRSGIVITPHQDVLTNANTEVMTVFTEALDDVISIYGLSGQETNIMADEGQDLVFVNSTFGPATTKTLNIYSGQGNDTTVVSGTQADTTTTVMGGIGDDSIILGSALSDNNGNLDTLYGAIHAVGGDGNDRIYMNDAGRTASYNYDIGSTYLRNGGSASNFFAGLTFDGSTETLRLDATNFRNHLNVTPSADTAFALYGRDGFNSITLEGDSSDGRRFFGQNGGDGFWTFTDGTKDVFFSKFLIS